MISDDVKVWLIIGVLALGTFISRFSFLGLIGDRELPEWILRHLRYTAVAVLPALIAPVVLFPPATNGEVDPARLSAAIVTLAVGVWTRNVLWAIVLGAATLYGMLYLTGGFG
ncbi:AzlD domain-containing protein [Nereida ignava]|uniref:Putative membrane protein n=1 Tax=Nereida ignava TaxID=282199 RepID=A0A0U1NL43_9RHOB|nr:AzlD domain-containing protein [Nereida ignava]CRK75408.1 putative membrane protein [Nereida ignava]SFJ53771.1 Branched-chain amino acid transport protein [Nereida ignava DSM 16309]